jgi:hypothetical protein
MKWLSSIWSKGEQGPAGALPQVSGVYVSLALQVLLQQLKPDKKYSILDLGSAQGRNIEFFSRFAGKISVEDLHATLASFDFLSPEDGFSYEAVFEYLLPYKKNTRFDVILAWDLLNYLERDEFQHLIRHLSKFCRPGTLLLALICTAKHMPDRPTRFLVRDDQNLEYRNDSSVLRTCPLYQQSDLKRLLPHFRVYNSFLLRNGMKEYLFAFE